MKIKLIRRILFSVALSGLLLGAAGCEKQHTYKIGVSQCSSDDWRDKMNEEIQREIMFHPEAKVEIRSADDNNAKQIADLKYFAENDFDMVIVAPNEADAVTPAVKEIYDSGIPVIVFDRDINDDSYTAFVGVDNVGLGRSAGHYANHLLPESLRVLEIQGLKGSSPTTDRHVGFSQGIKENPNAEIVASAYGDWNQDDSERVVDSLLNIYKDINLVYAHNDRMAIGAANMLRQHGMHDVKVIGIDAAPQIGIKAVADGVIDATFLYPTEGHRLVRIALSILKGEPFERDVKLPVASAVDKSNADILLLQNESLTEETSKMKILKRQVDSYWQKHSAQTTLFYAAIALMVLALITIFVILRAYWQRRHHHEQLMEQNALLQTERDKQRELNDKLNRVTQSKLSFFTGVSHDLRTPLTLISEPVQTVADSSNLTDRERSLMKIADKNVRILKRLINQILDFRKYETGNLTLNQSENDLCVLAHDWAGAFAEVARRRHIKLITDIPDACVMMSFDPEKMERVFFNLVSNAFKHTPDNGTIRLTLKVDAEEAVFTVADSGCGIPAADLPYIFKGFYQGETTGQDSSGIGLTLSKAFVKLHGGDIEVESELGKGTRFTVRIPVRHTSQKGDERALPKISAEEIAAELGVVDMEEPIMRPDLPIMLVIDDNADIRRLVATMTEGSFNVIGAANGKEGVRMAAKYVPDIIVCDVMMPVMDGLECCRKIKEEVSTSHIPVLMLTACSMDEQRARGYESGADGYLSKPFNADVFHARCRSLLLNRRRIIDSVNDASSATAAGPKSLPAPMPAGDQSEPKSERKLPVNDIDSEFYHRFVNLVNADMGNPELSVDALAAKMGLGRSQFYRKIKALTNFSPVELLRQMRVKKARQLLMQTEKSVSEIAYEVGFSSPAYFTKCYRDAYGETPSDLRSRI